MNTLFPSREADSPSAMRTIRNFVDRMDLALRNEDGSMRMVDESGRAHDASGIPPEVWLQEPVPRLQRQFAAWFAMHDLWQWCNQADHMDVLRLLGCASALGHAWLEALPASPEQRHHDNQTSRIAILRPPSNCTWDCH